MGNIAVDFQPPSNWADFEHLTLDVCRLCRKYAEVQQNGRPGQAQNGVDIFGVDNSDPKNPVRVGVQCKKRKWKFFKTRPSSTLNENEISAAVTQAGSFQPALGRLIIATTAPRDAKLQNFVAMLNAQRPSMLVNLWFWEDYVQELNINPELSNRYYKDVIDFRAKHTEDEHYYRLLRAAFDRPAILALFQDENRVDDFIVAISDVQNTVATGTIVNREHGTMIDYARRPTKRPRELKLIGKSLQSVRNLATKGIRDKSIQQLNSWTVISDVVIRDKLNRLRADIVKQLNDLLTARKIDPLKFG